MSLEAPDYPDAPIAELARLFREHPAWREAARRIRGGATSTVWFRQRPGEPWHLARRGAHTLLLRGAARGGPDEKSVDHAESGSSG